jgi:hypothetical protein
VGVGPAHPSEVPGQASALEVVGERLLCDTRHGFAEVGTGIQNRGPHGGLACHDVTAAQPRGDDLRIAADMHDQPRRVEGRDRRQRPRPVPELAVVVVLDDDGPRAQRPLEQLQATADVETAAQGVLVAGGDEQRRDRHLLHRVEVDAAVAHIDRHNAGAQPFEHPAAPDVAGVLASDAQNATLVRGETERDQGERFARARGDHHVGRLAAKAPRVKQVTRYLLAQRFEAGWRWVAGWDVARDRPAPGGCPVGA